MALRVEVKAKLLISNDNLANPQDIAFNSGDKQDVNTADMAEAASEVLKIDPSVTDQELSLGSITSVSRLFLYTDNEDVSVTLVPTGKVLADCSAIKLLAGVPCVLGSDLVKVYASNADDEDSATLRFGVAGT